MRPTVAPYGQVALFAVSVVLGCAANALLAQRIVFCA